MCRYGRNRGVCIFKIECKDGDFPRTPYSDGANIPIYLESSIERFHERMQVNPLRILAAVDDGKDISVGVVIPAKDCVSVA